MSDVLDAEDGAAGPPRARRCETLSQLTVEMSKLMARWKGEGKRFALVLDGADRQRDAPPTLVPALARLAEIVSLLERATADGT